MTTAAERARRQRGQSMIEFAFLLPVIILMLGILRQTEMAITTSIVNQKYSRSHLYFLYFNHRYYLEHGFLEKADGSLMGFEFIGVSNDSTDNVPGNPIPVAPERRIGAAGKGDQAEEDTKEPTTRQNVRIRTMTFTCVPPYGVNKSQLFSVGFVGEETFSSGNFKYCSN